MRHIPDAELHAYLDQALSRSQCIEIESHLARCPACSRLRDEIAALRDRTTHLLARVAPQLRVPPPIEQLRATAVARRRLLWRRRGLWAAGFATALVAGWSARETLFPAASPAPAALVLEVAAPVEPVPAPEARDVDLPVLTREPPAREATPVVRLAVSAGVSASAERTPDADAETLRAPLALDGRWLPATLDEAAEATGHLVPVVPGLAVVSVQVRRAGTQERPMVVVTQRHPGGAAVHVVEGPVADVADVVAIQLGPGLRFNSSEPSRSPPDYVDAGTALRRTSRVLVVVGHLPVDSLGALAGQVVLR